MAGWLKYRNLGFVRLRRGNFVPMPQQRGRPRKKRLQIPDKVSTPGMNVNLRPSWGHLRAHAFPAQTVRHHSDRSQKAQEIGDECSARSVSRSAKDCAYASQEWNNRCDGDYHLVRPLTEHRA